MLSQIILAPRYLLSLSVTIIVLLMAAIIFMAMHQPWLGLQLAGTPDQNGLIIENVSSKSPIAHLLDPGSRLVAINDITLFSDDLMEEPDALSRYSDYNSFLQRQNQLAELLQQNEIRLRLENNQLINLSPKHFRPLTDLPFSFWLQIICGIVVFMAGMAVLAFRPRETVARLYAITGFGLLLAAGTAAVYSTRELALPTAELYPLSLLNQFGSLLFAGTFVSILWYYPQRLHTFNFGAAIIIFYLLCWLANAFQLAETLDQTIRIPLLLGLAINIILAMIQWWRSRQRPLDRAILKWFLFAWMTGTSLYLGLYTLPVVIGHKPFISQSLGWIILLTVYLGIALGISRYRLFDLDRWVLGGWLWLLSGLGLIVIDMLLVYSLDLNNSVALAITLAVAGWVYFPLRQYVWGRFTQQSIQDLLPQVLSALLSSSEGALEIAWRDLLIKFFAPMNLQIAPLPDEHAIILDDGSELLVAGPGKLPSYRLHYANDGKRLFGSNDLHTAKLIRQLFQQVLDYRRAFAEGVKQERSRLARDLHDDVGARLLSLVYNARENAFADQVRAALGELRSVIHNLEAEQASLIKTLAELRLESSQRAIEAGVELHWTNLQEQDHAITPRAQANIRSILREAVSNALRHGPGSSISIHIQPIDNTLEFVICNDLTTGSITSDSTGRGLRNVRDRINELHGKMRNIILDEEGQGAFRLEFSLPINHQESN